MRKWFKAFTGLLRCVLSVLRLLLFRSYESANKIIQCTADVKCPELADTAVDVTVSSPCPRKRRTTPYENGIGFPVFVFALCVFEMHNRVE